MDNDLNYWEARVHLIFTTEINPLSKSPVVLVTSNAKPLFSGVSITKNDEMSANNLFALNYFQNLEIFICFIRKNFLQYFADP